MAGKVLLVSMAEVKLKRKDEKRTVKLSVGFPS